MTSQTYEAEGMVWLGTNLIHDFTAVTFSVKLAFFREKRPFPWNPWFFVNFNAFTFIYDGFQSFINSFYADFAVCYTCHTSALSSSWHVFTVLLAYIRSSVFVVQKFQMCY